MNILRQQRKRLEPLFMLLLGLICGICLSQLLQSVRLKFYKIVTTEPTQLTELHINNNNNYQTHAATAQWTSPNEAPHPNGTRILCMVAPSLALKRAKHIQLTWGKRCDKLIFMHKKLDTKTLNIQRGQRNSWSKMRSRLHYLYKQFYDQYEWFLIVKDDTYVIMENLRHFLSVFKPEMPFYFGHHDWEQVKQGYTPGGAGYVFSKAALQLYATLGHDNSSICSNRSYGIDHVEIARCLRNVGVIAGDSRDAHGLERFLPIALYAEQHMKNISDTRLTNSPISFHYSNVEDYHILEYFIYRLKPFGFGQTLEQWPAKMQPQTDSQKLPSTASQENHHISQ